MSTAQAGTSQGGRAQTDGAGAKLRILVAEDEELIGHMMQLNLRHAGFDVTWVKSGDEARHRGRAELWDLVVLDVMMPGASGFDVARALREARRDVPILMVTARGDTPSKVRGLDSGADDYLVKPFDMAELLARVRALLRRTHAAAPAAAAELRFGRYQVDLQTGDALTNGGRQQLSAEQTRLMALFARHRGTALSRADLVEELWGPAEPAPGALDGVLAGLRRLFEPDPDSPVHLLAGPDGSWRFGG
jgi:DNA-binding response OmpR family regulator